MPFTLQVKMTGSNGYPALGLLYLKMEPDS